MPRSTWVRWLGVACLTMACEDRPPTTLVVAVSSEAPLPDGVSYVELRVERNKRVLQRVLYEREKGLAPRPSDAQTKVLSELDLPGTITIVDKEIESGPVRVSVEAMVVGKGGVQRQALRTAQVTLVEDKQKLLRMPIQLSCAGVTCKNEGESCRAGDCLPEQKNDLEELDEAQPLPEAGKCFERSTCEEQGGRKLTFPIEVVAPLLDESDCSVPYIFPGEVTEDDGLDQIEDTSNPRLAKLRGSINMGYIWSGDYNLANKDVVLPDEGDVSKILADAAWTVVDNDPVEGWNFSTLDETAKSRPNASQRVVLSRGLCEALRLDKKALEPALKAKAEGKPFVRPPTRLLGTVELRGCQPKNRRVPECKAAGSGGAGGAGGASSGGKAGQGGASSGGAAGAAGGAGGASGGGGVNVGGVSSAGSN